MQIEVLWFDVDGTLIRTGGAGKRAFVETARLAFGIEDLMEDVRFAGRTDRSLVAEFFHRHQIPNTPENFSRFYGIYVVQLRRLLPRCNGKVCQGVNSFLSYLYRLGNNKPVLGLLTGNIYLGAEIKLRHFNLWHHFQLGVFGDYEEDRHALASQAYTLAKQFLGHELVPEQMVVIGDTPADVLCGKAIGARTLAVATGGASWEELEACKPDLLVPNLEEVVLEDFLNHSV